MNESMNKWMNKWKCSDLKCVRKPTSLTHRVYHQRECTTDYKSSSSRDIWSGAQSPERLPRRMTAPSRWRSSAVVKPHRDDAASIGELRNDDGVRVNKIVLLTCRMPEIFPWPERFVHKMWHRCWHVYSQPISNSKNPAGICHVIRCVRCVRLETVLYCSALHYVIIIYSSFITVAVKPLQLQLQSTRRTTSCRV